MAIATPIEVFHRVHALVRTFDERAVDCYAADAVFELPFAPPPLARRCEGREAIRAMLAPRYAALRAAGRAPLEYTNLTVHETRDPEVLVAEFEVENPRFAADGARTLRFIHVYRIVGGEIALHRDYFDSLVMAERLRVS